MTHPHRPHVAIVNSSEDLMEIISQALEDEGYETSKAHVPDIKRGTQDFLDFLKKHDPRIIIYDIGPPYEENLTFYRLIHDVSAMKGRCVILTSTNKKALLQVQKGLVVHEVMGKPYDLEELVAAVKRQSDKAMKKAC